MDKTMSETNQERCAVCGAKLKRGEHRACRKCVVAVATMRAIKRPYVREALDAFDEIGYVNARVLSVRMLRDGEGEGDE